MKLFPEVVPLGPLNPDAVEFVVGLVLFGVLFAALSRLLLPRIRRVQEEREARTEGTVERAAQTRAEAERVAEELGRVRAEARREAARVRHAAEQEGAELVAAARSEAIRERDETLADGRARIASDRAAAEEQLREDVGRAAEVLAARVLGEPVGAVHPLPYPPGVQRSSKGSS